MNAIRRNMSTLLWLAILGACGDGGGLTGTPDGPGPDDPGPDITVNARLELRESELIARVRDGGAEVLVPLHRRGAGSLNAEVTIEFLHPDGEVIRGTAPATITDDTTVVRVEMPAFDAVPASTSDSGEFGGWVLRYEITSESGTLAGRRSLYLAWEKAELVVLGADAYNVDGTSLVRVLARDPRTGEPLADREVEITLVRDDERRSLFSGSTDATGMLSAPIDVLEAELGNVDMEIRLAIRDGHEEVVEGPIRVVREQRILVTTDKPMYQPGQRIHIRALALSRPSLQPVADQPAEVVISDAKGNKVFRETLLTDAFGVVHLDFPLADYLNLGDWKISVDVGGEITERTVRVDRYVLPKFGITLSADRGHYRPGDTALLDIDARYFFGQPVADATVLVQPYTFDVGFNPLPPIEVALDANGLGTVEVPITSFLAGTPLEQGNAIVRVDVSVTDATEHTQTATRNLIVANQDLLLSLIPATRLVPGRDNTFYAITRTPAGRPVEADCTLLVDGEIFDLETDTLGYAEVIVGIPASGATSFELACEDATGRIAREPFSFEAGSVDTAIAVLSDGSLYDVGDSIELAMITSPRIQRVFLDVVRDGQTLLTDALDVTDGRAEATLDLSPDMSGTLRIDAWYVTEDAQIVRGHRTVYVQDASQLAIDWQPDQDTYRPGEDVSMNVRVTDADGQGVRAALGVTIVDEAVFALQDMQPGMERVYFQLESELLDPRYTLYGWSIQTVASAHEYDRQEREAAASVILAQTEEGSFGLSINTLAEAEATAASRARAVFLTDAIRVRDRILELDRLTQDRWTTVRDLERDIDRLPTFHDPWGTPYEFSVYSWQGDAPDASPQSITLTSAGMDEVIGTDDDLSRDFERWDFAGDDGMPGPPFDGGAADAGAGGGDWDEFEPSPMPEDPSEGDGDGGGDQPRVRSWFPETLLVAPDLITDEDGNTSIQFPVADSITTWRITGLASSTDGQLGSSTAGIQVFQPFFIDINFPVELTQNDRVAVPIAIFNYLETPQTVELRVDRDASGDWFTLLGSATHTVNLQPGEITVRYFDVQVDRVGRHPFQVTAIGSEESDAIRRVVRVAPDGQSQIFTQSERLAADVAATFTVPAEAIEGASSLLVKIYPGMFSQVVEGLDSLLRVPSGCFEQTSSTTYPNVLVLQYLRDTESGTPDLELRATELIAQGYQRLVSYEVDGGGFEWFGNDPAHRILTAYGLLQFTDMARVYSVDPDVIARTQQWLLGTQEADGRFRAAQEGIHEGATNAFTDSDLRATAYLTYALLESGVTGPQIDRAVAWINSNRSGVTDNYTLGLLANVYLAHGSNAVARTLLDELDATRRTEENNGTTWSWWESESQSLYYSSGQSMNMEVSALILQAMIRAGGYADTVTEVVDYLIGNKNEFGNFSSTQATILTLRALIELVRNSTPEVNAEVRVFLGDHLAQTLTVDASNSDLLRQVDLSSLVEVGDNNVRIEFSGEGALLYQIVGEYFLPWSLVGDTGSEEILSIDNAYDRTTLAVDESVTVTTTVQNRSDARLDMVMLDLGVPPGFDPILADFDAYIADPDVPVTRVERKGRQLTVYVYGLDAGETLSLDWRLRATMAVTAQTPPSAAWLYYDEGVRTEAEPVTMNVN